MKTSEDLNLRGGSNIFTAASIKEMISGRTPVKIKQQASSNCTGSFYPLKPGDCRARGLNKNNQREILALVKIYRPLKPEGAKLEYGNIPLKLLTFKILSG